MTARQWLALVGTWLGIALFLILLQRGRVTPTVFADELTYGRLAENIAHGLGKTFHGLASSQRTLYVYLVAPAWALFDGAAAYRVALTINALVMTFVVLPTFAIARTVTASFRAALAAGALAALAPSMVWAGMLMTEPLAYPAAAVSLLATLMALRRPGPLTAALAGVAVIAAYFARTQMMALGGVLVVAVLMEVARHGRAGLRTQIVRHRWLLSGAAVVAVAGLVVVFARQDLAGGYACILRQPPSPGEFASPAIKYLGIVAIACGLVPAIGLIALAFTPSAWRDDRTGPLLCVALGATGVLLFQAAWTVVTTSPELQERYVFYAAPAVIPVLLALPGRVAVRKVAIVTAVAAVYCAVVFPGFQDVTGKVVTDRIGLGGPIADALDNQHVLWTGAALVLGGLLAYALRSRRAVVAALALTAIFSVPVLAARQLDANRSSSEQAALFQQPLTAVDDIAHGRPAAIVIMRGSSMFAGFQLQLWNQSIGRVFRVGVADEIGVGQACPILVGEDGTMRERGDCSGFALPSVLVLLDGAGGARLPVDNGTVQTVGPGIRVWQVPPGQAPRIAIEDVSGGRAGVDLPPDPVPGSGPAGRCNGT